MDHAPRRPAAGDDASSAEFRESQSWFRNPVIALLLPIEALVTLTVLGAVTHQSSQPPSPLVYVVLAGVVVLPPLVFGVLPLRTIVLGGLLRTGFIPPPRYRVELARVTECEVVRYSPLGDCGGWGWKKSRRFGTVFNVAGDRGVRLTHIDGQGRQRRVLIGSRRAEELASVINRSRPRAPAPPAALPDDRPKVGGH